MGGYIALALWRQHAHRIGRLILSDTKAAADSDLAAESRWQSAARVLAEGVSFLADGMIEKLVTEKLKDKA